MSEANDDNSNDINNGLKSVYRKLLVKLNEELKPNDYETHELCKAVAGLEKEGTKLMNRFVETPINDLKMKLNNKETKRHEFAELAKSSEGIINKVSEMKKMNQSIELMTKEMKEIECEQKRTDNILKTIDNENDLLVSLKDEAMKKVEDLKQNI